MENPVRISAEIGINHNGDLALAERLINAALLAGCDSVKFQKRSIEQVYTREFLASPRESPWGKTQRAQKEGLEFSEKQYDWIDSHCRQCGIAWFASCWDVDSQKFMRKYDLQYNKIASPVLTNLEILNAVAEEGKYTFIATGMSTWEEIDRCVEVFVKKNCPFELMHCVSVYPMPVELANLLLIPELRRRYNCPVGYSSHEIGNIASLGAVALGAKSVERHVTLDRNMYGSDQKSSVEPAELIEFVKQIRSMQSALGSGQRQLSEQELAVRKKMRG
ncbi:MAG: N-acetylneuraminate synthase family protein [Lentisphaeria bacterium]|jgi:N-acetylneuraminate synthase|nr:N-acetylneuraminate synthase family protein [Lentisphaeria bacterium]